MSALDAPAVGGLIFLSLPKPETLSADQQRAMRTVLTGASCHRLSILRQCTAATDDTSR